MSRVKRVFEILQRQLPGTMLCKDVLVVLPVDYILKGFLLETTTERDLVYLWRVVTPLYRPMQNLSLSHSERIAGDKVYIDREDYKSAASLVHDLICGEHMDYLHTIRTPLDFLYRHRSARGDLPISVDSRMNWDDFVRALTHYLVGNEELAIEGLRAMDAKINRTPNRVWHFAQPLKQFLCAAEEGPTRARRLLDDWVNENVERQGLQRARLLSAKET